MTVVVLFVKIIIYNTILWIGEREMAKKISTRKTTAKSSSTAKKTSVKNAEAEVKASVKEATVEPKTVAKEEAVKPKAAVKKTAKAKTPEKKETVEAKPEAKKEEAVKPIPLRRFAAGCGAKKLPSQGFAREVGGKITFAFS